jgi:hypothetical protein
VVAGDGDGLLAGGGPELAVDALDVVLTVLTEMYSSWAISRCDSVVASSRSTTSSRSVSSPAGPCAARRPPARHRARPARSRRAVSIPGSANPAINRRASSAVAWAPSPSPRAWRTSARTSSASAHWIWKLSMSSSGSTCASSSSASASPPWRARIPARAMEAIPFSGLKLRPPALATSIACRASVAAVASSPCSPASREATPRMLTTANGWRSVGRWSRETVLSAARASAGRPAR